MDERSSFDRAVIKAASKVSVEQGSFAFELSQATNSTYHGFLDFSILATSRAFGKSLRLSVFNSRP